MGPITSISYFCDFSGPQTNWGINGKTAWVLLEPHEVKSSWHSECISMPTLRLVVYKASKRWKRLQSWIVKVIRVNTFMGFPCAGHNVPSTCQVCPATALWWSYWNCTCFREIGKLKERHIQFHSFFHSSWFIQQTFLLLHVWMLSGFAALQVRAECLAGSKAVRRQLGLLNKCHRLGDLKSRILFSYQSGVWKSWEIWFLPRPLSVACMRPPSLHVLTWLLLWAVYLWGFMS